MSQDGAKPKRNWREIAAEASKEHDLQKLLELSEELRQALDERERESK
jgi:hypothetical protein